MIWDVCHLYALGRVVRTPENRREGRMAIRTNFCQKKCTCRILSGRNLENFAQGRMFCPSKNCQLQWCQMDIRTIFDVRYMVVVAQLNNRWFNYFVVRLRVRNRQLGNMFFFPFGQSFSAPLHFKSSCFLICHLTISCDYFLALFRSVLTTEHLKSVKWAMVHSLNLTEELGKSLRLQMLSLRQGKGVVARKGKG